MIVLFLTSSYSVGFKFLDEEVYIRAGAQQWSGVPPALTINPEHPPLAKYIIGVEPRLAPLFAGIAVVFLAGWLGRLLGRSFWLVAFSVASDIVFTATSRFAMLDVFVALFSVSAVLSYLLGR
ncbi:hypothetical protein PAE0910 [Pyrobaculum aerophilum str. IM2]|uniref:ArnT-like N-terminal domain-containing protein n=2 Tax=Pyrobaculum aerophilum TaxID=13773 RepID=Q8ZY79_PYRAE